MDPDRTDRTAQDKPVPADDRRDREAEAAVRYQTLFDTANDAIFLIQDDRFIDCNPMTLKVFGCSRDQILGQRPHRFSPPRQPDGRDSREAAEEWIRRAIDSGPQRFEWLHTRHDGTPFFAEVSLNRVILRGKVSLQSIVRDINERKVAEQDIRRSEARYRNLFDKASDGIVVCASSLEILDANPSFAAMTGYSLEELRLLKVSDLYRNVTPTEMATSIEQVRNGGVADRARRLVRRDGSWIEVEARSKMLADGTILEMYRDVTEARRQEEERQRLARIEMLGVVAGGIAHDFNNILTAALGYVELAAIQAAGGADASESLQNVVTALERARDLTGQLLTFARGGEPIRRVISLAPLVRESARFALRGSNVAFVDAMDPDLWLVEADEGQLSQVFHNVVLNARQVMPQGGEVRVVARNLAHDESSNDAPEAGPCVEVVVFDQGGGIDPEIQARIFDPYFTTKSEGRGLGLATAYRIVQRHGGQLSLTVEAGVGCAFRVLLPASPGGVETEPPPPLSRRGGSGRILVMDDDRDILAMLRRVLEQGGYQMVGAVDGVAAVEALKRASAEGKPVDLAIVDLTVPGGMGGRQVLPLLREASPGLPVIVSSGYSDDPVLSRFRDEGFEGACAKPYRIDALLGEVARVLEAVRLEG